MSKDKKQSIATGDFDPAADIMFKLQDFWLKYKNVVVVVVLLVSAGLFWYSYDKKAKQEKLTLASNDYSFAIKEIAKDTTKAIELLTAVYDEHAETYYARYSAFGIAELYLTQGNAEKAIEWFDNALATKGSDIIVEPESYEGKAVALELMDKTDEAKAMYEKVLAMESHRTNDIAMKLAYLEMKSGNSASAEKYCQTVIADTANVTAATYNAQALLAEITASKK